MTARLFLRIQTNLAFKKVFRATLKTLLFALVLTVGLSLQTKIAYADITIPITECSTWPRPINCYKTLWGTDDVYKTQTPDEQKDAIKNATGNGVAILGLKTQQEGGFDNTGTVKKLAAVVTLRMDLTKYRGWNMVGASYCTRLNLGISSIGGCDMWNHKDYVRFIDDAFVVRIYQKDASGNIINESLTRAPANTFLGGGAGFTKDDDKKLLEQGKPLHHIIKFFSGSGMFSNFWNNEEDGYTSGNITSVDGTNALGMSTPTAIAGSVVAATATSAAVTIGSAVAYGTVVPGLGNVIGAVVGTGVFLFNQYANTDYPELVLGQNVLLDVNVASTLAPGQKTYAELWYAGTDMGDTGTKAHTPAGTKRNEVPDKNQPEGSRIRYFAVGGNIKGDLTGDGADLPYFQIGPTAEFTTPTSLTDAIQNSTQTIVDVNNIHSIFKTNDNSALPNCAIVGDGGTFLGCVAQLFYYAIYTPLQWFAGIMGKVFDFFLGYSLDDQAYRADFIVTAWKVIRDISNIFFIIILIYTGLAAVFDIGNVSMKRVVPHLIINALIINFSLFVTRTAIDASNIFARVFYNRIYACTGNNGKCIRDANGVITNSAPTIGGYKQASPTIIAVFNPQRIFTPANISLDALPSTLKNEDLNNGAVVQKNDFISLKENKSKNSYAAYFILVSAIAAAIMLGIAVMFWKAGFFFLGRVVGLYVVMIFSPFAFLTRENMPLVSSIKKLRWSDWLSELTSYALLAPIFVFFLLIIYTLATSPFMTSIITSIGSDGDIIPTILSITIPMLIVYFMIKYGVDLAKQYAGYVGGMVQEWASNTANKVVGVAAGTAIGVASGGLGMVGRSFGSVAKSVRTNSKFGKWIDNNQTKNSIVGWTARRSNNALAGAQKVSFDPRNSKFLSSQAQSVGKQFGIQAKTDGSLLGALKLNSEHTKGGLKAYEKRKEKEMKENIEKVETHYKTEKEATAFYDKYLMERFGKQMAAINKQKDDSALLEQTAKKELDEKVKEGKITSYTLADVKAKAIEHKQKLEEKSQETFEQYKTKQQKTFGQVKDNKTLTQALRLHYATELKEEPATFWDAVRMAANPMLGPGDFLVEEQTKRDVLSKYIKDTQKSFKSTEKAAKELESIDNTLTAVLEAMHKKDPTTYTGFRNNDGNLDSKTMGDDDRNEMLKRHRADLETELDEHERVLDELKQKMRNPRSSQIDIIQKAYDEAIKRGDQAEADRAENELKTLKEQLRKDMRTDYQEASKKRNEKKEEIDDLKNILRRRTQAEQKVEGKKDGGKKEEEKKDDKEEKK